MTQKQPIPLWQLALKELHKGHSLGWIAMEMNISRRTIQRWKNGQNEPDSDNASAIMKLHERVFK